MAAFRAFDLDKVKQVAVILEISQPPQNGQELILQFVKIPLDRTQSLGSEK